MFHPRQGPKGDGAEAGDHRGSGRAMRYRTTRPRMRRIMSIDELLRAGTWPTKIELIVEDPNCGHQTVCLAQLRSI